MWFIRFCFMVIASTPLAYGMSETEFIDFALTLQKNMAYP